MLLKRNTSVYHATNYSHVASILNNGIKEFKSVWGEGELGAGFYTATTVKGAAAYLSCIGAVIEFTTISEMTGVSVVPAPKFDWSKRAIEIENLCKDYDFLCNAHDIPVSQFKFTYVRGTQHLKVTAIYMKDFAKWKRFSISEYCELV